MKKFWIPIAGIFLAAVIALPASAHVVVKPASVGVGERTNFAVSVPTEEDVPTTQVRLVIPEGLRSVRPNVKPGWNIEIKRTGEGEAARVSEIIWSGGQIPAEQRDEFVFSAQAPAAEAKLAWKAYQTYAGGKVVAWDQDPQVVDEYEKNNPAQEGQEEDPDAPRPFSVTTVVDDLAESEQPISLTAGMSGLALVVSVVALAAAMKRKSL
jgi:uncharacterized protein YcnI